MRQRCVQIRIMGSASARAGPHARGRRVRALQWLVLLASPVSRNTESDPRRRRRRVMETTCTCDVNTTHGGGGGAEPQLRRR